MADLLLYHAVPSRSMSVHWMLEEVGEPYELKVLSLEDKEHETAEYLAVNPQGRVPTLVHGDRIITESGAINAYLADTFPAANLAPPIGSPLRGEYYRWLFFGPAAMEPAILWAGLGEQVAHVDYKPFPEIDEIVETLRKLVTGREYVVGDHFTTADLTIGGGLMWGMRMFRVMPELPEFVQYWERLEQRPAWQRSNATDTEIMSKKRA